jgi:hypothetical protein
MYILENPTFRRNISLRSSRSEGKPSNKSEEAGGRLIQHGAAAADVLIGLFFDPEDRSDIFFRNVGLSAKYTALQPRGLYYYMVLV